MHDEHGPTASAATTTRIDRRRLRRLQRFFLRVILHVAWWDVVLALPVLRFLRSEPIPRWCALARRYRALAVEFGGVLIKLGQYLSVRVDLLPIEVVRELSGLQDEVPPASFEAIREQIDADFDRPLDEIFAHIDTEPLGAASLAQVHAARLTDGREVVVKVLRPGIEVLVETDLIAITAFFRRLKMWRFLRRRVDLDWVAREFADTTRAELDMRAEGKNAERFAENFAEDPTVEIPAIIWEASSRHTLTEENVGYIRVGDFDALDRAGIDRTMLARRLFRLYLEQTFLHRFVHADPHPGNLFVKPLAGPDDPEDFSVLPGQDVPEAEERPFQVVFVDFGMVAVIPPRLTGALEGVLIGFATRDASRIVRAYAKSGTLLPGADLAQIEETLEKTMDRFWGIELGRASELMRSEASTMWRELRDIVLETPIQVQVDLLFSVRALEVLAGVALRLDPNFNPWPEVGPFATRLMRTAEGGLVARLRDVGEGVDAVLGLPVASKRLIEQTRSGRLAVRTSFTPDARRQLDRIDRGLERLTTAVLLAALFLGGVLIFDSEPRAAIIMMAVAGALAFLGRLRAWWKG
ncbi:MAG: AarF/UbiB family protein [Acidobacteriota bacterium]